MVEFSRNLDFEQFSVHDIGWSYGAGWSYGVRVELRS